MEKAIVDGYLRIDTSRGVTREEAITIAIKRHGIDNKIRRMVLEKQGVKGIRYVTKEKAIVYLDFTGIGSYSEVALFKV